MTFLTRVSLAERIAVIIGDRILLELGAAIRRRECLDLIA
jgi:hypothetical protein